MKKLIMILMAAVAFSCGDGNRSSERDNYDRDNTELAEPDTTNADDYGRQDSKVENDRMKADTTSTWDRDDNRNDPDSVK